LKGKNLHHACWQCCMLCVRGRSKAIERKYMDAPILMTKIFGLVGRRS